MKARVVGTELYSISKTIFIKTVIGIDMINPGIFQMQPQNINITKTVTTFNEKVLPIIEKEETNIILDLSNLDFLSSVGMMDLAKYLVLLTDKKRLLKLVKPSKPVYDTMAKMGFAKRFDMYDSLEAAMSSF